MPGGARDRRVALPDPRLDALVSVALVCESDDLPALQAALATYAGTAFQADWVVVMAAGDILASWGNPPAPSYLTALAGGTAASPDLAIAPLEQAGAVLLTGRTGHDFRERERAQLTALARIADHVWRRLAGRQWEMPTPPLVSAP